MNGFKQPGEHPPEGESYDSFAPTPEDVSQECKVIPIVMRTVRVTPGGFVTRGTK